MEELCPVAFEKNGLVHALLERHVPNQQHVPKNSGTFLIPPSGTDVTSTCMNENISENFSVGDANDAGINSPSSAQIAFGKRHQKCYVVVIDQNLNGVYSNLTKVWKLLSLYERKAYVLREGEAIIEKPLQSYSSLYRIAKRRGEIIIYGQHLQNPAVVLSIYQTKLL